MLDGVELLLQGGILLRREERRGGGGGLEGSRGAEGALGVVAGEEVVHHAVRELRHQRLHRGQLPCNAAPRPYPLPPPDWGPPWARAATTTRRPATTSMRMLAWVDGLRVGTLRTWNSSFYWQVSRSRRLKELTTCRQLFDPSHKLRVIRASKSDGGKCRSPKHVPYCGSSDLGRLKAGLPKKSRKDISR